MSEEKIALWSNLISSELLTNLSGSQSDITGLVWLIPFKSVSFQPEIALCAAIKNMNQLMFFIN